MDGVAEVGGDLLVDVLRRIQAGTVSFTLLRTSAAADRIRTKASRKTPMMSLGHPKSHMILLGFVGQTRLLRISTAYPAASPIK